MSGLAVYAPEDRQYCATVYYLKIDRLNVAIHFVVTWNTEVHRLVVLKEFRDRGAIMGPTFLVGFMNETIRLDIPMDGVTVAKVWQIIPLMEPVISKTQVDTFQHGQIFPSCQLQAYAQPQPGNVVPMLIYSVGLIGAKEPFNRFTITYVPPPLPPVHDSEISNSVDVVEETTVVVTNSRHLFPWKGYGLKLHIPDHCLPADLEQCTIKIQASLAGQYEFPENCHPVSPVYWFHCKPNCKFLKPIEVEMQHCAQKRNVSKLRFVRFPNTQKQPQAFMTLGGTFSEESSYGVIQLDSFSAAGIVQDGSDERQYFASVYYLSMSTMGEIEVHIVFTWNDDVHINVVKEQYQAQRAVQGAYIEFELEPNVSAIKLDIPDDGLTVNNSWKIVPQLAPIISKSRVDQFTSKGGSIPSCQLKAVNIQNRQSEVLSLDWKAILIGAKPPNNWLRISHNPKAQHTAVPMAVDTPHEGLRGHQRTPKMSELLQELISRVSHEWVIIGYMLDIDEGTLMTIKKDRGDHDINSCLQEMLVFWLKRIDPPPTWSAIIEVLECLGNKQLAGDLKLKYCTS